MKKLILTVAIVLGTLTTVSAQTKTETTTTKSTTATVDPSATTQDATTQVAKQEEYKEIATATLPEAVTKATAKSYPGAVINKAYINAKNEYQIEVTVGDQRGLIYADATGNWLKK